MLQFNNSLVISKEVEKESETDYLIACVTGMVLTRNSDMSEGKENFKDFICRKIKFGVEKGRLLRVREWPFLEIEGKGFKSVA